jgi:peptide/nickel transport system ATP-binding protein
VIRYFCDRVAVMYRGKVVETGETNQVCDAPTHPYTQALLSAIPQPDPRARGMHKRFRYNPLA